MTLTENRSYPTAIRFGAGRIAGIAIAGKAAGITKPLLVTDTGRGGHGDHRPHPRPAARHGAGRRHVP